MTELEKIQQMIDEVEANNKSRIEVVWIDGLEFRDPDKFMEYLREKGYI